MPVPQWRIISGFVRFLFWVACTMTLIAGGVSVAQLAKSKSSGDFIAGIVASVVLTGGMGIVAALLRRLGKRLRAKKL